jgi:hypothetical protein
MADSDSPEYPKLPRNIINRYKPRGEHGLMHSRILFRAKFSLGKYDYETIHSIVNTSPVLHVSFTTADEEDPFPATIPMLGFVGSFNSPTATLLEPCKMSYHFYVLLLSLDNSFNSVLYISSTFISAILLQNNPSANCRVSSRSLPPWLYLLSAYAAWYFLD